MPNLAPPRFRLLRARWRRLDRLVRAIIVNWLLGMGVGVVCAAILLVIDFDGVRSLILRSDMPVVAILMLFAGFAFTFGGLVCAAAVMLMGSDDSDGPGGGGREWGEWKPVRIRVPARAGH